MTLTNAIRFTSNAALASPAVGDLYLPVFGGQVLTRYSEYLGITSMVRKQQIASGDTATFPRLGGIGAERHAANTQLLGLSAESTELSIGLDPRPLVSHFVIDDVDEMLSHFETRSHWARETGQALAEAQDQYTLRLLINASRETPTTMYGGANSAFPGGGIAGDGTDLDLAFSAAVAASATGRPSTRWDDVRVPFTDRNLLTAVPMWHGIRQFGSPRSATDLNNGMTPLFMASDGTYGASANQQQFPSQSPDFQQSIDYNGVKIWRSNIAGNQVFGQDLSADDEARYQGDFSTVRAVAFQADGVAVVEKMAITTETDRQVDYQNWLFVSKMLTGGGTLRPECVVSINDDA
jgi:hypothetical protein